MTPSHASWTHSSADAGVETNVPATRNITGDHSRTTYENARWSPTRNRLSRSTSSGSATVRTVTTSGCAEHESRRNAARETSLTPPDRRPLPAERFRHGPGAHPAPRLAEPLSPTGLAARHA